MSCLYNSSKGRSRKARLEEDSMESPEKDVNTEGVDTEEEIAESPTKSEPESPTKSGNYFSRKFGSLLNRSKRKHKKQDSQDTAVQNGESPDRSPVTPRKHSKKFFKRTKSQKSHDTPDQTDNKSPAPAEPHVDNGDLESLENQEDRSKRRMSHTKYSEQRQVMVHGKALREVEVTGEKPGDDSNRKHRKLSKKKSMDVDELAVSCRQLGKADFEGWMHKKSGGTGITPVSWKKWWCVLKNGKLYLYKTSFDPTAQHVYHLKSYALIQVPEEKRKCSFKIQPKNVAKEALADAKAIVFATDSEADVDRWSDVLQKASQGLTVDSVPENEEVLTSDRRRCFTTGVKPTKPKGGQNGAHHPKSRRPRSSSLTGEETTGLPSQSGSVSARTRKVSNTAGTGASVLSVGSMFRPIDDPDVRSRGPLNLLPDDEVSPVLEEKEFATGSETKELPTTKPDENLPDVVESTLDAKGQEPESEPGARQPTAEEIQRTLDVRKEIERLESQARVPDGSGPKSEHDDENVNSDSTVADDDRNEQPVAVETESDPLVVAETPSEPSVVVETPGEQSVVIMTHNAESSAVGTRTEEAVTEGTRNDQSATVATNDEEPAVVETHDETPDAVETRDEKPEAADAGNKQAAEGDADVEQSAPVEADDKQQEAVSTVDEQQATAPLGAADKEHDNSSAVEVVTDVQSHESNVDNSTNIEVKVEESSKAEELSENAIEKKENANGEVINCEDDAREAEPGVESVPEVTILASSSEPLPEVTRAEAVEGQEVSKDINSAENTDVKPAEEVKVASAGEESNEEVVSVEVEVTSSSDDQHDSSTDQILIVRTEKGNEPQQPEKLSEDSQTEASEPEKVESLASEELEKTSSEPSESSVETESAPVEVTVRTEEPSNSGDVDSKQCVSLEGSPQIEVVAAESRVEESGKLSQTIDEVSSTSDKEGEREGEVEVTESISVAEGDSVKNTVANVTISDVDCLVDVKPSNDFKGAPQVEVEAETSEKECVSEEKSEGTSEGLSSVVVELKTSDGDNTVEPSAKEEQTTADNDGSQSGKAEEGEENKEDQNKNCSSEENNNVSKNGDTAQMEEKPITILPAETVIVDSTSPNGDIHAKVAENSVTTAEDASSAELCT